MHGAVKALLLAAGYATRLFPLTENRAKALLPVGGRPMLDWIADKIDEVAVVDELHVVDERALRRPTSPPGRTLAGGPARPGRARRRDDLERRPARRDRRHRPSSMRPRRRSAGDDLLVVAGDNLFEFSLADYVAWWRGLGEASAVAVRDCGDLDARAAVRRRRARRRRPRALVRREAARAAEHARLDRDLPLPPRARAADREYLAGGNPPDAPGNLVAWLHTRRPVYGYRLEGDWFDVGDREQLLVADNWLRRRHGLPERTEYSL